MGKNPAQTLNRIRPYILSAFSGVLLVLIFPRFNLEFLAWIALIPLFFVIQEQPLYRVPVLGFLAGMVFYFFGLHWVTNTMVNYGNIPLLLSYPILALLAAYLSLYVALFCYLTRKLSGGDPLYIYLLAPVIWTSLEYLRSTHGQYGFSWLGLGYSQFQTLPVIQIAEYTGEYGISTLIVFINGALFFFLNAWLNDGNGGLRRVSSFRVLGVSAVVLIFCLGYGIFNLKKLDKPSPLSKSLTVGLVQGNIEQSLKWDPRYQDQVLKTYRNLTLETAQADPDLVVWPEASTPFFFNLDETKSEFVKDVARNAGAPLLFGSPYSEVHDGKQVLFNSAYLLSAQGKTLERYDKIHLVPFGEFVPFKSILWFVDKMVEGIGDFKSGKEATLFKLGETRFGVSICYEIIFPDLVRLPVKKGAQFLVNITNDAWFGKSAAAYQHISMAALRAVENRVPIVRAANTGISGMIDATGKIRQATDLFVEDMVIVNIKLNEGGRTFYSRNGDLFSYLCIFSTLLFGVMAYRFRN